MFAREHCNDDQNILYVYFTIIITIGRCQIFILKKKTDLMGFFTINPRYPDGLKKTDLDGKKQQWEPWAKWLQKGNYQSRNWTFEKNYNQQCCQLFLKPINERSLISGVERNFWLAKYLTSHLVHMHRVIFYIPNMLINFSLGLRTSCKGKCVEIGLRSGWEKEK